MSNFYSFTFVSSDNVRVEASLTPFMVSNSMYLHAAVEAGEVEGYVPVATAATLQLYIAFSQYMEYHHRLRTEFAAEMQQSNAGATPYSAEMRSMDTQQDAEEHWTGSIRQAFFGAGRHEVCRPTSPPLDCDALYARAARYGHQPTGPSPDEASDQSERPVQQYRRQSMQQRYYRRGTATAPAADASSTTTPTTINTAATPTAASAPVEAVDGSVLTGGASEEDSDGMEMVARSRYSSYYRTTSISSSDASVMEEGVVASSGSTFAKKETAGKDVISAVYRRPMVGVQPGYGEVLLTEDREGVFFIENILLQPDSAAFSSIRCSATAPSSDAPNLQKTTTGAVSVASPPRLWLTVSQQLQLLMLLTTADFLGDQRLVELCSRYLAAWLMDCDEGELIASFLSCGGDASATSPPLPSPVKQTSICSATTTAAPPAFADVVNHDQLILSRATSMQERWLIPAETPSATISATAAVAATGIATSAAASSRKAKRSGAASAAKTRPADPSKSGGAPAVKPQRPATLAAVESVPIPHGIVLSSDERDSCCYSSYLSADQRLSLLRHIKQSGATRVDPY